MMVQKKRPRHVFHAVRQQIASIHYSRETAMLIKIRPDQIDIPLASEITPQEVYASRRAFMGKVAAGAIAGSGLLSAGSAFAQSATARKLPAKLNSAYAVMDKPTAYQDAT